MFEEKFITNAIARSAETAVDRRKLLTMAGLAGVGAAAALATAESASAAGGPALTNHITPSDASILNFALNLEYLEAEFYLRAVTGSGLDSSLVGGLGTPGAVFGGRKVNFQTRIIRQYAREIAADERAHVAFLRAALGPTAAVARPTINIDASFTAAAKAAGLVSGNDKFDPYANEVNFLFAAFIFEDVGVTAYKGAAPLLENKTYLDASAGLLAVEAYHAGIIRTVLYGLGVDARAGVQAISDARDSLDGGGANIDQGIRSKGTANLVPTDANGLAFSRTPGQVLNVVYLNPNAVTSGGFYPNGVNGQFTTSAQSV